MPSPLFKSRLQCLICCKLAFGNDYIAIGDGSGLALLTHELHILTIDSKDIVKSLQLGAQRGCLKRQRSRVASQSQIGRVELVALIFGKCDLLLDSAVRLTK